MNIKIEIIEGENDGHKVVFKIDNQLFALSEVHGGNAGEIDSHEHAKWQADQLMTAFRKLERKSFTFNKRPPVYCKMCREETLYSIVEMCTGLCGNCAN